jgi:hypothetical protein
MSEARVGDLEHVWKKGCKSQCMFRNHVTLGNHTAARWTSEETFAVLGVSTVRNDWAHRAVYSSR